MYLMFYIIMAFSSEYNSDMIVTVRDVKSDTNSIFDFNDKQNIEQEFFEKRT